MRRPHTAAHLIDNITKDQINPFKYDRFRHISSDCVIYSMFEKGASEVPKRKNNFSAVLLHYETIQMMVAEQK